MNEFTPNLKLHAATNERFRLMQAEIDALYGIFDTCVKVCESIHERVEALSDAVGIAGEGREE